MCTAISYRTHAHYFGRTLDLDHMYRETVTITPRNFPFAFRKESPLLRHYAIIGMATVVNGFPLYYDATNEKGLSIAGLNFPEYAVFLPESPSYQNIAPFELIPWILGQCANVSEARTLLQNTNLFSCDFSPEFPQTPLHWLLSDREASLALEPLSEGFQILEDPVGVLTNSPPLATQLFHLRTFRHLSSTDLPTRFAEAISLEPYSTGTGSIGLPGDFSSLSRFVRAAFVKLNSFAGNAESESVAQFFHILASVSQPCGCNILPDGGLERTVYTSCCNTDLGIYYYTTYENRQISAVCLDRADLDSTSLATWPLQKEPSIHFQN